MAHGSSRSKPLVDSEFPDPLIVGRGEPGKDLRRRYCYHRKRNALPFCSDHMLEGKSIGVHLNIPALPVSISSAISLDKLKKLFCAFFVLALLASSTVLTAQQHHHHEAEGGNANIVLEKLGAVHMPISCAASVQTPFERGIALLHFLLV
jgi:hypothetical protein